MASSSASSIRQVCDNPFLTEEEIDKLLSAERGIMLQKIRQLNFLMRDLHAHVEGFLDVLEAETDPNDRAVSHQLARKYLQEFNVLHFERRDLSAIDPAEELYFEENHQAQVAEYLKKLEALK